MCVRKKVSDVVAHVLARKRMAMVAVQIASRPSLLAVTTAARLAQRADGVVVSMRECDSRDPGSIPGRRNFLL